MKYNWDNKKLNNIKKTHNRNCWYRNAINYTACPVLRCPMLRVCYENLLFMDMMQALASITEIYKHIEIKNAKKDFRQMREFTLEELSKYDGTMGKSAYVAVNGTVYDVSNEPVWGGASHFGLIAGKDLTSQFNGCHGNIAILSKLPEVGILKS